MSEEKPRKKKCFTCQGRGYAWVDDSDPAAARAEVMGDVDPCKVCGGTGLYIPLSNSAADWIVSFCDRGPFDTTSTAGRVITPETVKLAAQYHKKPKIPFTDAYGAPWTGPREPRLVNLLTRHLKGESVFVENVAGEVFELRPAPADGAPLGNRWALREVWQDKQCVMRLETRALWRWLACHSPSSGPTPTRFEKMQENVRAMGVTLDGLQETVTSLRRIGK
jgi:hypothetical protein